MDALPSNRVRLRTLLRTLTRFFLLCLSLVLGAAGHAAQQGSAGPSSSGTLDVLYTQGLNVRVNGLADFPLGTWGGTGPLTANDDICIGRTGVPLFGTGVYRVLASGDGEPGDPSAFTLSNGIDRIYYNAYFNDAAGLAGRTQLTGGVQLTNQTAFGLSFFFNIVFNCGWQNANLSIEVPESELSGAAGTYTGTLTVMLLPE